MKEYLKSFKPSWDGLWFVFFLALFSGFVNAGGFLMHGALYWDTGKIFIQFRNNLEAINSFGEIAYWFPQNQLGSPGYYHSILGIPSCLNPAFIALAIPFWIMGRVGIIIKQFQPVYVFYFAFLIPFFFLCALRAFARRIFSSNLVIFYVLIIAAFSPGITFNLTDIGYLEPTIYSLFFGAMFIDYLRKPNDRAFRSLTFSLMLLAVSFNHAALYWNLFAVPAFLLVALCMRRGAGFRKLKMALGETSNIKKVVFGFFVVTCFLPNLIAYMQGSDLIRSSLGETKSYPYEKIAAGNPLEMLVVSLPGFGFDWNSGRTNWKLLPMSVDYHTAHYYLGLLCLPLLITGLLFGNRLLRSAFFVLFIFFYSVMSLSAYSPIFSVLLWFENPLRHCNHFSDAAFKAGSYLLLIFSAGLGLQTLVKKRIRGRHTITFIFSLTVIFSVGIYLYLLDRKVTESLSFGLLLFSSFLFFIALVWLVTSKNTIQVKKVVFLLLLLTLVEVSTHSFLFVRNIWNSKVILNSGWPAYSVVDETPSVDGIGILTGTSSHFYPNILLMYRSYFHMLLSHFNPETLPIAALFSSAHVTEDIEDEMRKFTNNPKAYHSLALSKEDASIIEIKPFLVASDVVAVGQIQLERKTYNTLKYKIVTDRPQLFFIRDGYSPYWSAKINQNQAPVYRGFFNFKVIRVPAGISIIELRFNPPFVGFSIFCVYFLIFSFGFFSQFRIRNFLTRRKILSFNLNPS